MWRSAERRDEDGGRHPVVFVVPGERTVVTVKEAARLMRKSEAEVARLAALRFPYSRHEDGQLKVEPAIVN
jgi:hypothetical protein